MDNNISIEDMQINRSLMDTTLKDISPEDMLELYFNDIIQDSTDIDEAANLFSRNADRRTRMKPGDQDHTKNIGQIYSTFPKGKEEVIQQN
jgi:hypothetical protein